MKRLINDPYDVVEEMLAGYVTAHKDHVVLDQTSEAQGRVVVSKSAKQKDKVGVIIGGGSGHEPLFLGYVGKGFADAAVIGNINTSPSPDPCYASVKAVDTGKGCIYLYGNYAGDVMNFDMGAEKADEEDGIRVETVLVTDDVISSENIEDRRGIAGDFFVFKAAGAKAEMGGDLDAVVAAAKNATMSPGPWAWPCLRPPYRQKAVRFLKWKTVIWKSAWVSMANPGSVVVKSNQLTRSSIRLWNQFWPICPIKAVTRFMFWSTASVPRH